MTKLLSPTKFSSSPVVLDKSEEGGNQVTAFPTSQWNDCLFKSRNLLSQSVRPEMMVEQFKNQQLVSCGDSYSLSTETMQRGLILIFYYLYLTNNTLKTGKLERPASDWFSGIKTCQINVRISWSTLTDQAEREKQEDLTFSSFFKCSLYI